jgi:hypothetical protein
VDRSCFAAHRAAGSSVDAEWGRAAAGRCGDDDCLGGERSGRPPAIRCIRVDGWRPIQPGSCMHWPRRCGAQLQLDADNGSRARVDPCIRRRQVWNGGPGRVRLPFSIVAQAPQPLTLLQRLAGQLRSLEAAGRQTQALEAQLAGVIAATKRGQSKAMCGQLRAFAHHLDAVSVRQVRTAASLRTDTRAAIVALGCSSSE